MATLDETLKKLNKDRDKEDQFKIASDFEKEHFDVELSSFGSPLLDYIAGGIGLGRTTEFVGWEGAGKSTFALLAASEYQKKYNKVVVYLDGEYTVDNSYLDRMNINRDLFLHITGHNLEKMLDIAEEFSKVEEVGMIIIDSVKAFTSSVVEDKTADQDTIGVEAKKLNARIPIIAGNCANRKKAFIVLNQVRENPGQMFGNPEVIPGGHWQRFIPSCILFLRKPSKSLIIENDVVIGHTVAFWVRKSKYRARNPDQKYEIDLYYDSGFDIYKDYATLFELLGFIEKKGSWYTLPNGDKVQGLNGVADFLESNGDILKELIEKYERSSKDADKGIE